MSYTVQDILKNIATFINQDPTIPTGTELTTWINLVDQAQKDWANAYFWKTLTVSGYSPSFGLSAISLGLPANFKKLTSPVYDMSKATPDKYVEIPPAERFNRGSTDKYVYLIGDEVQGKALIINPALPSGASIVLDYQSYPSSLVTVNDTIVCPSPQFLAQQAEYYILQSRSDTRFPSKLSEANNTLANLIESEATKSGGENNQTKNYYKQINFRIGQS